MAETLGTLVVKLEAEAAKFNREMDAAAKRLENINAIGKKVALGAAAVAAGLGLIGAAAVRTASTFERGMTRVGAVAGASGEALKDLTKTALKQAATTEFTARQVSGAMVFLAQSGLKTEKILGAIPKVLSLASAAMVDVSVAADIVTSIMSGMGKEVTDLTKVNDSLIVTMNNSKTDLNSLGQGFKKAGPIAAAAGIEFSEVAAALGRLGDAGFEGGESGIILRRAMIRLLDPTDEVAAAIDKLGIATKNQDGSLLGFTALIKELEKAGADVTDTVKIFGSIAGPGMSKLLAKGSESLGEFRDKIAAADGQTQNLVDKVLATFSGQMNILASKIEGAAIVIGNELMPVLSLMIKAFGFLVDLFVDLPGPLKSIIVAFFALTAGLAAVLVPTIGLTLAWPALAAAGATVAASMAGMNVAVLGLNIALLPALATAIAFGLALIGVAAAIGAVKRGLKGKVEFDLAAQIKEGLFLDEMGEAASGVSDKFKELFGITDKTKLELVALVDPTKAAGKSLGDLSKKAKRASKALDFSEEATELFGDMGDLGDAFNEVDKEVQRFDKALQEVTEGLPGMFRGALEAMVDLAEKRRDAPAEGPRVASFSDFSEDAVDIGVPQGVLDTLGGPRFGNQQSEFAAGVESTDLEFGKLNGTLASSSTELGRTIEDVGKSFASNMGAAGQAITAGLEGGPMAALGSVILSAVTQTEEFQEISEVLNGIIGKVAEALGPLLAGLLPLIETIADVVGIFIDALAPVLKLVGDQFRLMGNIMRPLIELLGKVVGVVGGMIDGIVGLFSSDVELTDFDVSGAGGVAGPGLVMRTQQEIFEQELAKQLGEIAIGASDVISDFTGLLGLDQAKGVGIDDFFEQLSALSEQAGLSLEEFKDLPTVEKAIQLFAKSIGMSAEDLTAEFVESFTALDEFGDNLKEVNEELTNVAQGFKISAARFKAIDAGSAVSEALSVADGLIAGAVAAPAFEIADTFANQSPTSIQIDSVSVQAESAEEFVEALQVAADWGNTVASGTVIRSGNSQSLPLIPVG